MKRIAYLSLVPITLLVLLAHTAYAGVDTEPLPGEDSLLTLIACSDNDSLKMEWYNELRRLTIYENPARALTYIEHYGRLAKELKLDRKYAIAMAYKANCLIPMGRYEEALQSLFEAETYFYRQHDLTPLGSVYNSIAVVYEKTQRDSLARIYFSRSLDLAISNEDPARQALALNNIANIYYRSGDYRQSKNYLEKALAIQESLNKDYRIKYQLNYANTLLKLNMLTDADRIYKAVLTDPDVTYNFTRCLTLKGMSKLLQAQGKYKESALRIQEALQLAMDNGFEEEKLEILELSSTAFSNSGDFRKAYEMLAAYQVLKDSLTGTEKDRNLIESLTKYDTEKKQQEILLLESQNRVKDLEIQKAAGTRKLLLVGLLAAVIIIVFAVRMQVAKTRHSKVLEQNNKAISKALREKNILLREIHHRVKNNLQVISSLLKLQAQYIRDESALRAISEGRNRVNSMAILHQNLYKEDNLTGVDMKDYFTQLLEGLFDAYNIDRDRIRLSTEIHSLTLDIDTVIPLGLIANELVSNALKHAFEGIPDATLHVSLWEEKEALYFKVRDNGIGIGSDSIENEKGGFGQKLILTLAEKLEAEIKTTSTAGTEVLLKIRDYKKAA